MQLNKKRFEAKALLKAKVPIRKFSETLKMSEKTARARDELREKNETQ